MQGFTGLIFVAIAIAWLVYLVPLFLHRKDNGLLDEVEPGGPITPAVTIVRRGVPIEQALAELAEAKAEAEELASTPLTRRAALAELHTIDRRAALRRSLVLGALGVLTVGLGAAAALHRVPVWAVGVPVALIAAFVGVARFTVVRMRAELDARAATILEGADEPEPTVAIRVAEAKEAEAPVASVDLAAPTASAASLWDPIPVTVPTYMSKPLAPRTVRTIDLSAPVAGSLGGIPVTADAPVSIEAAFGLVEAVND